MKRNQRPSSSPALPTVRALPPQRRRLADIPGVRPLLRIGAGIAVALLILGGAAGAVMALDRHVLPPIAIPLASLAVLAATAAFLAGRAEGKRENSSSAERSRAKGRLQKGKPSAGDRARAGSSESASRDTTDAANTAGAASGIASQAGSIALRTKFLDDISQALRAPITSICLAARIIRKHYDSTPEVVAHFGDTLLAEADRLGQTVDEFLELARLESGLIEWHEDEVDAADLIQRAVAEVESVAVSYGVSVAFTMEPGLPPLHVDRERVAQALTILLAIAVRSASEGSEIVIQIAGAHGGWVFTVGGTSFVYPHAEARKVHVRADGAPTPEQPESRPDGLGLGLCLCREIVARYQGRLWIEGTPGASGCARFTIPYRQHRRAAVAASATTAANAASTHGERPATVSAVEQSAMTGANVGPVDLEQRREAAVKVLRERAAAQPRVENEQSTSLQSDHTKPAGSGEIASSQQATDAQACAAPAEGRTEPTSATAAATPDATDTGVSSAADDDARATSARPGAKISFGRRQRTEETPAPARPAPTAQGTHVRSEDPRPADLAATQPEADSTVAEAAVEVEIVDDSPVQAPVSGTMITATHRTAGPPVLANPGVPALSGMQSAANAAMQGSDELLLEIAEAQSPDGRSLVVSEEVRSLLASAPGTLPAVAGQNAPAVPGRAGYTPSKRRMVQAPWVVRSGSDGQTPAAEPAAETEQAQRGDPAVPGQRARLNERLAKRLGLTGSSQTGRNDNNPGGSSGAYMRSRRLGSR